MDLNALIDSLIWLIVIWVLAILTVSGIKFFIEWLEKIRQK